MMPTIRVIIADDHRLVRAGLCMLLAEMPGIVVLAEAADGNEALAACDSEAPDLVLMDIAMPNLGGLDALGELRKRHPGTRVLMLSMLASEEHVLQALRLGASGYLLKDAAPAELALAIEAVMRGETWLSSAISRPVVDGYMARVATNSLGFRAPPHNKAAAGKVEGGVLTPRQQEVLRLLAEGKSTKEIAFLLDLSIKTIETHRAQIMERLDVHDLAGLVRYAVRNGIVAA
jgi:DNA-binding NarL/FixJ family response regulator